MGASSAAAMTSWVAALVQGLRELGWIEGRTGAAGYSWADGRSERIAEIADEFVRRKVDVIVTHSAGPVIAASRPQRLFRSYLQMLEMADVQTTAGHSGSKSSHPRSDEARISRPPSRRSKAMRMPFSSLPSRWHHRPGRDQHLSGCREAADDMRFSGICRSWQPNVLRHKPSGPIQTHCRLRGQDSARDEARTTR